MILFDQHLYCYLSLIHLSWFSILQMFILSKNIDTIAGICHEGLTLPPSPLSHDGGTLLRKFDHLLEMSLISYKGFEKSFEWCNTEVQADPNMLHNATLIYFTIDE